MYQLDFFKVNTDLVEANEVVFGLMKIEGKMDR